MNVEQRVVELTIKHSLAEGRKRERQNVLDLLMGNLSYVEQQWYGTTEGEPKLTLNLRRFEASNADLEEALEQLINQIRSGEHIP